MSDDLTVLRQYADELSARLDASILEANDIPAQVSLDTAGGAIPAMAFAFPIRLIVRAEDAEVARELLDTPVEPAPDDAME